MQEDGVRLVNKEDLKDYRFVGYEVLETETEIENRKRLLEEAMLLGNTEKQKVKIVLETETGPVMVQTTIWEANDSFIELKGIAYIPIGCISEIII